MKMKIREFFPLVALVAVVGTSVAACGGDGAESDDQAALDRDMDLALADDSLAALGDTASDQAPAEQPRAQTPTPRQQTPAPTPRPRQQTPAPKPADPGPQYRDMTVPGGSTIAVTLNQELSTRTSQVGDLFTTTVASPVTVNGDVAIPAGSQIRGRVTAVQKSGKPGEAAVLKVAFDEVTVDGDTYPVQLTVAQANPTSKSRSSTGEKAGKIGIGALAGAVIGQVIGGDSKSTIIGAAVGAAAGSAIVLGSGDSDAVLAEGSAMTLTVDAPLPVRRQV
jgi:uncharacterized membrane protein